MRLPHLILFASVLASIATSQVTFLEPLNYGPIAIHNPSPDSMVVELEVWTLRSCERLRLQPELLYAFPEPETVRLVLGPGEVQAFGSEHECAAIRLQSPEGDAVYFSDDPVHFDRVYDDPARIQRNVLVLGDSVIETSDMRITPWAIPDCEPLEYRPFDIGQTGVITELVDDGYCQSVTIDDAYTYDLCAGPLFPFAEGDEVERTGLSLDGTNSRLTLSYAVPFTADEMTFVQDGLCVADGRGMLYAKSVDTPIGMIHEGDVVQVGNAEHYIHHMGISLVDERRDDTAVYMLEKRR